MVRRSGQVDVTRTHIAFVVNNASFLCSHRLPLVQEALRRGWTCTAILGPDEHERDANAARHLTELGCRVERVPLSRSGLGPVDLARTFRALRARFRQVGPTVAHLVTPKLLVVGGIAAQSAGVPAVVFAVSGLGFMFSGTGLRGRAMKLAAASGFRLALRHPKQGVIVQNADDETLFRERLSPPNTPVVRIHGSGVDLAKFRPSEQAGDSTIRVVFPGRMLRSKGVVEFLSAVAQLKHTGLSFTADLAGEIDPGNPDSLSHQELERLASDAGARWLGHRADMAKTFRGAHIACLPSYREGLPLALAEAAAAGLAVVTTDVPGCRETVVEGLSGLMVPARDVSQLADALRKLITDPALLQSMQINGRRLAEEKFGVEAVVARHFEIYHSLIS